MFQQELRDGEQPGASPFGANEVLRIKWNIMQNIVSCSALPEGQVVQMRMLQLEEPHSVVRVVEVW